jgi:predicted 2-oxoglutarate/Fe(II)-dependent dioxygenase YbiX
LEDQTTTTSQFDLLIVRDFFDAKTCGDLIHEMRRAPVNAALTYGKGEAAVDETIRRARHISPPAESVLYVKQRLAQQRPNLEKHFAIELGGFEEPQFLDYRVGDFFVAHQDGNTGLINLESDRRRRISITIFLNTQSPEHHDGYTGGSLVLSDWRSGAREELIGHAGMLVAFRSETTHEVMPVTHGERHAIVTWYGRREG